MRILMLNNEFPPLGGGTGSVNLTLLERFSRMSDIKVDLVTSALGKHSEEEKFSNNVQIYKVPVNNHIIHHSSNRELLTYAFRALILALKLNRQYHYDFCFAWSAVPAGGVALILRWVTGLCYLVRVCGPDIPGFERRYAAIYTILTPVIKAIWNFAEVVVAKCKSEADMIHAVDANVDVELIPNGVDTDRFQPSASTSEDGPLRLLCVARLIDRKGQRFLIEAVRKLVDDGFDVQLDLIGTGDSEADYQALVRKLGLEDHIRFLGYIPRDQIPQHYSDAQAFVLPSYNEGMSVATLEALASGLPVIVTRAGGMDELVDEGENGFFFDWADIKELASHLEWLVSYPERRVQMSQASRKWAKRFSWDAVAKTYFSKFQKLLKIDV